MAARIILGPKHTAGIGDLETAWINLDHVISVRVTAQPTGNNEVQFTAHLHDVAGKITDVQLGKNLSDDQVAARAAELIN